MQSGGYEARTDLAGHLPTSCGAAAAITLCSAALLPLPQTTTRSSGAAIGAITGTRTGTGPALLTPVGVQNDLPPRASIGRVKLLTLEQRHEQGFAFLYSRITDIPK